jgi:hypothetical protein
MLQIRKAAFFKPLCEAINRGIMLAPRLIHNCISNDAEHFMSICSKYISGKRVHYGARGGYNMRMTSAMFSFDDCGFWAPTLYKSVYKSSPSTPWTVTRENSIRLRAQQRKKSYPKVRLFPTTEQEDNNEYGIGSRDADADENIIEDQIQKRYTELQVDPLLQAKIEEETRQQSESSAWFRHRRERITASNAKLVFKLRQSTSNTSAINTLLYPSNLDHIPALQYGRDNERNAIKKYEHLRKQHVKPSGLVVSLEDGIFAASPDGFVGEEGLIEVKCPIVLFLIGNRKNMRLFAEEVPLYVEVQKLLNTKL